MSTGSRWSWAPAKAEHAAQQTTDALSVRGVPWGTWDVIGRLPPAVRVTRLFRAGPGHRTLSMWRLEAGLVPSEGMVIDSGSPGVELRHPCGLASPSVRLAASVRQPARERTIVWASAARQAAAAIRARHGGGGGHGVGLPPADGRTHHVRRNVQHPTLNERGGFPLRRWTLDVLSSMFAVSRTRAYRVETEDGQCP